MNIKKMPLEDLELMSYTDIAYEIIKGTKKRKTTIEIFREVCDLLQMDETMLNNLVADFFASMTTDKRFLLLEEGTWDLRDRHASSKVKKGMDLDDEEEEEEEIYDDEQIEEDESLDDMEEEDEYDSLDEVNDDDDFDDDSLDDLVIVDEKDLGMDE